MSPASPPTPSLVELKKAESKLYISWTDGHQSVYGLRYLRGFCPCAQCQGHAQGVWTFVPVERPEITKIEETGSYALSIVFSDGHATGIYSFEILRELCPCEICQAEQGAHHPLHSLPSGERA